MALHHEKLQIKCNMFYGGTEGNHEKHAVWLVSQSSFEMEYKGKLPTTAMKHLLLYLPNDVLLLITMGKTYFSGRSTWRFNTSNTTIQHKCDLNTS
jgi:hypothetical protein